MRIAFFVLLSLVAGAGFWFVRSSKQAELFVPSTLVVPHMNLDVKKIANEHNIPIWAVQHPQGRIFTLCVCFQNAGYVGASPEERGISDVLASLLDEGYKGMNGRQLKEFLLTHSIDYNVSSDADHMMIVMRTVPEKIAQLFEVLTGMLTSPACLSEDAKRIEEQLYASLSQKNHMPQTLARDKRMELAYGSSHPYAFSTEDQAKRVMSWTSDQLKAYAKKMFVRSRLHMTLVGAYQTDELNKLIESFVQALPVGEELKASEEVQAKNDGSVTIVNMPIPQTVISWTQEGLSLSDPRFYALHLANEVLGGGGIAVARLMREIREKNGLAYGVGSRLFSESNGLGWFGTTATQTGNAQKVMDMIRAIWAEAATKGITQGELDQAKSFVMQAYPHTFSSTTGTAGILMRYMLSGRDINYVNTRNEYFEKVTLEDVNAVCKSMMKDKLTFVVVGQHEPGALK